LRTCKHRKEKLKQLPVDQALQKGIEAHKSGNIQKANYYYKSILKVQPTNPDANHNIGVLSVSLGKLEQALTFFQIALKANPKIGQFWLSYISTLIKLDKIQTARTVVIQAKGMGIEGIEFEKIETNLDLIEQSGENDVSLKTSQEPEQIQLHALIKLFEKNDFQQVCDKAEKMARKETKSLTLFNLLYASAVKLGHLEKAIDALKKAISIKPDYFQAYNDLGVILKRQGNLEEAIKAYNKALSIMPNHPESYNNLGNALTDQGKLEEAVEAYTNALSINPNYVDAYANMGVALHEQGKLDEAISAYTKALDIRPDHAEAHENLSYVLFQRGRLKQALDEYEWRWKNLNMQRQKRHFAQPLWDGQHSLSGKRILIWCEQGVGDTLNWSFLLPNVASIADQCILECQEKLVPLLTRSFPNVEILVEDRTQDLYRNDFNYHLPMGSLYRHFIPVNPPYIQPNAFLIPDPKKIHFWKKRLKSLGNGPFIGVCWKSSDISFKRGKNYSTVKDWFPIFKIPDVTFVNLQYTDFQKDLVDIKNQFGVTVHNFDDIDHFNDLDNVAALCAALDMVISTKTTVPIISASVGTVTKLANWRQSPWNNILLNPKGPSVEIFERNTWEEWSSTLQTIADSISTMKSI
jgi:tetratricopeptide (TPR) repeat protein